MNINILCYFLLVVLSGSLSKVEPYSGIASDGIQNFKNRFSFELYLLLTGSLIFITNV